MSSLVQLRRRLKSIRSIHQITKAMEMIATSKMQRATKKVLGAQKYAQYSLSLLQRLASLEVLSNPFFELREINKIALLFLASDRGLCGGFNSSLFKELHSFLKGAEGKEIKIITVGKKGRDFVKKFYPKHLLADFTGIKDEILWEETTPITHLLMEGFLNKDFDQVLILYTQFISAFAQRPTIFQLLPVEKIKAEDKKWIAGVDYLLEPTPTVLMRELVPLFLETQVFQALLESKASEHSARMMAMRNATENASQLMDEIYLAYHSLRQATITSELADMITAKRAMEE